MQAEEIIFGNYIKTYDGCYIRIDAISVLEVLPLQENWIIAATGVQIFRHLAYFKSEEGAKKSLDNLINYIKDFKC